VERRIVEGVCDQESRLGVNYKSLQLNLRLCERSPGGS
jgi:hypothetical protein